MFSPRLTLTLIAGLAMSAGAANAQFAQTDRPVDASVESDRPALGEREGRRMHRAGHPHRRGHRGDRAKMAELREQFDANADGELDEAERAELRSFVQAEREERKAKLMAEFDADGDGELSADEKAAIREAHPRAGRDKRSGRGKGQRRHGGKQMKERALSLFDIDGDGELNEAEQAEAKAAHEARKDAKKAKALELFDANGDGEITGDEREAAKSHHRERREAKRAETLKEFDADGDGKLTGEERENARAAMKAQAETKLAQRRMDVNRDGEVTAADLDVALERVASGSPTADFNNDGVTDHLDVVTILKATGQ